MNKIIKKDLKEIEKQLLERRVELEHELDRISKETLTDNQVQDAGDQALSSTMETVRNSFQDTEMEEYNRIIQALKKIKDGTYGICLDCNQQISEKRLKSYPNAARCLACQEAYEDKTI